MQPSNFAIESSEATLTPAHLKSPYYPHKVSQYQSKQISQNSAVENSFISNDYTYPVVRHTSVAESKLTFPSLNPSDNPVVIQSHQSELLFSHIISRNSFETSFNSASVYISEQSTKQTHSFLHHNNTIVSTSATSNLLQYSSNSFATAFHPSLHRSNSFDKLDDLVSDPSSSEDDRETVSDNDSPQSTDTEFHKFNSKLLNNKLSSKTSGTEYHHVHSQSTSLQNLMHPHDSDYLPQFETKEPNSSPTIQLSSH